MPTKLWRIALSLLFCTGFGAALTMAFITTQSTHAESNLQPSVSTQMTSIPENMQPLVNEIETQMQQQQIPGMAVAIVQNGTVIFQQGFGVRNTETNDSVTPKTLFRIGSTTKPLTVVGLMRLVEAGQVDLDASVASYLPEFQVNPAITVKQLISHTSGLADFAEPYGRTDETALRDAIARLTPESVIARPGQVLSYSNPGFNTAGRVIEVVSGQSYPDYMQEFVFNPLGMTRTTFKPTIALTYPLAVGYQPGPHGLEAVRPTPDNGAEYPAGLIFSNVEDLSRFLRFLLQDGQLEGETLLSRASVQAMKTPVLRSAPMNVGYGLGLFVTEDNSVMAIGHGGSIHGYTAILETFPERDLGIVILSNKSGVDAEPILDVVKHSLLHLSKSEPSPPISLNAADLQAYAGSYRLTTTAAAEPQVLTIAVEDDHLKGQVAGQPEVILVPLRPDVFQLRVAGTRVGDVTFLRDDAGQVTFFSQGLRVFPRLIP